MTALRKLAVDLGDRSYPIIIGPGAMRDSGNFTPYIRSRQLLIVTNETVGPLYLETLTATLEPHYRIGTVILPDGEQYKTLDILNRIFDKLLGDRFDRGCTLLALGGGVIGDITGFAAACYQRGVDFVQVPTTLLSQVDSSVGGKTGVNHPLGKNMIGAFHQPRCVIADTDTLATLPDRELSAGLAEVIKYGLINDPEFFSWLESSMDALVARDPDALGHAIERSCSDKADVVAADEKEAGQRALLNFGHTFGHAIENGMGYGEWLHGEAVGAGMCMAAHFSVDLGLMPEADAERAIDLIRRAGLPVDPPHAGSIDSRRFLELMSVDKKVQDGQLRLVLMKGIGNSFITTDFSLEALAQSLDRMIPS